MSGAKELDPQTNSSQTLIEKIDALNDLAWDLRHKEFERALDICQNALELSTTGEFSAKAYQRGQATSLTTLAFLNHQVGKFDIALGQCFQATMLLEALPPTRVNIDAWRITSLISFFVGDFARALDFGLKALRLAQELKLGEQEASVWDGLALVYEASGDAPLAASSHQTSLRIAQQLGNKTLESVVLNNWANFLLDNDRPEEAFEYAQQSLDIARQLALNNQTLTVLDTMGLILARLGRIEEAAGMLHEALELAIASGSDIGQVYCLFSQGKLFLGQNELSRAQTQLQKALELAQKMGMQPIQANCHLLLSELFEQQGQFDQALAQHKKYFASHEKMTNEVSAKRLAVLRVAQEVETANRDAEIYMLRNVDLQLEINERKRMEDQLRYQGTHDILTGIYNRAFFETELARLEHSREYPTSVVVADVDDLKITNDRLGHATGDELLRQTADLLQATFRKSDVIARIGGDEFAVLLPSTNAAIAEQLLARVREQLAKQNSDHPDLIVKLSLGSAVAEENKLVEAFKLADQCMYADKAARKASQHI